MQGAKRGTPGVTGAAHCEGASMPAVKISGGVSVSARVAPGWSDRTASLRVPLLSSNGLITVASLACSLVFLTP